MPATPPSVSAPTHDAHTPTAPAGWSSAAGPADAATVGAPAGAAPGPDVHGRWATRVLIALVSVSLVLTLWSFALPFLFGLGIREMPWWRSFFEVNHEVNLAAWWSAGLLLLGAAGFAMVGLLRRALRVDRPARLAAWLVPAGLLATMSLDEFTQVHERGGEIWDALPFTRENPLHAFQALVLMVPAVVVVVIALALCARALPRRTALLTGAGILVFLIGAVALEAVPLIFDIWRSTWTYHAVTHAEEFTEMLGSSLLVVAPWVHLHLTRSAGHLQVRADPVGAPLA